MKLAIAILVAMLGVARADIPSTVSFTARVVDDTSGKALTGSHHLSFQLFDAEANGNSVWMEGRDLDIDDGLVYLDLGETKPLDATVFTGKVLYLEVSVDDNIMDPRIALSAVPYAIRAGVANDATTVGGVAPGDFQKRVTGTCSTGNFMTVINPDGSVTCAPASTATGTITGVTAGSGLVGGGSSGNVTLSLMSTCDPNEILKWSGTAWLCAADATGVSSVTAGSGLMASGTATAVTLSLLSTCGVGQLLKWSGSGWACANDIDTDTNSGGTITGVTVSPQSGLVGGGTTGMVTLSLPLTCAVGQMLKWNGSAWACADDIDTDTNSGGTITGVTAGLGLTGGGTTGAVTVNIGAGPGIIVNADNIALDTTVTDARYVIKTGDTMQGDLNMNGHFVTNRGCPANYGKAGPGLCFELSDVGGLTMTGAANRCRTNGSHMCSSAEMRSSMSAGLTLGTTVLFDWLDDQDAVGTALYVTSTTNTESPEGSQATSTTSSGYSRCCRNVE